MVPVVRLNVFVLAGVPVIVLPVDLVRVGLVIMPVGAVGVEVGVGLIVVALRAIACVAPMKAGALEARAAGAVMSKLVVLAKYEVTFSLVRSLPAWVMTRRR